MTDRSLTMISIARRRRPGGRCRHPHRHRPTTSWPRWSPASERAAREAAPADDAFDLVDPLPTTTTTGTRPPPAAGIEVFAEFAPALGAAFELMDGRDERLYGFAEHELSSTWLATSTGLRRRFDQPDGRLELNAKSSDLTRSAWAGVHTTDFADVDLDELVDDLHQRLEWARTSIELPAGRYETILPPTAVADLMIYAYWTGAARDAEEGRSVFSAEPRPAAPGSASSSPSCR